jgi:hypothetical protein
MNIITPNMWCEYRADNNIVFAYKLGTRCTIELDFGLA